MQHVDHQVRVRVDEDQRDARHPILEFLRQSWQDRQKTAWHHLPAERRDANARHFGTLNTATHLATGSSQPIRDTAAKRVANNRREKIAVGGGPRRPHRGRDCGLVGPLAETTLDLAMLECIFVHGALKLRDRGRIPKRLLRISGRGRYTGNAENAHQLFEGHDAAP